MQEKEKNALSKLLVVKSVSQIILIQPYRHNKVIGGYKQAFFIAGNRSFFLFFFIKVSQRSQVVHDRAIINCQFSMAAFSTPGRKKRIKGDRYALPKVTPILLV